MVRGVALSVVLTALAACGNDAVGVNACRQIEGARCRRAAQCPGISLEPPYHTSGSDVDECIRYYDVACLHGLAVSDPGGAAVNDCISAIYDGPCQVVASPASDSHCAWLAPSTTASSASTSSTSCVGCDASSSSGSSDASSITAPADATGGSDADAE